jgi:MFS family permease
LVAVLTADVVSTMGSEMTAVALPWFVLVTTGSAARMAGVMAAEFAGIALLGLPAGRIAHGLGPRRALLAADGLRAPLVVLIPLLYWAGLLHYVVLLLIGLAVGGCFPAYASGQRVLLASVTGDDDVRLTRAGALLGGVNETASFIGPALGGGLIAWVGAPWVLVVDAVTYVASFALVGLLVPASAQVADDEPTTPLPDFATCVVTARSAASWSW